jgi:hypothetical protein
MKNFLPFAFTALSLSIVLPAQANDAFPASYRGDPLSVEAHWTSLTLPGGPFDPPALNIAQNFNSVDDLDLATTLFAGDPFSSTSAGSPYLELTISGMDIFVPNWIDTFPLKQVRIQITYLSFGSGLSQSSLQDVTAYEGATPSNNWSVVNYFDSPDPPVGSDPGNNVENTSVFDIEINPNPDWEVFTFTFPGAIQLQQIHIDTVSVPEPSAYALAFGLMAMAVLIRRRSLALRK